MERSANKPFSTTRTGDEGQPERAQTVAPETTPNNSETIPESELFGEPEQAQEAIPEGYKKKGKVGRKRKYEEFGNEEIEPVRDVVLWRFKMGRHWPGMSEDMVEWYEFYYFTKPSKKKDGDKYEQHVRAWERGQRWISDVQETPTLGDSGKILAYRRRAAR